jgi:hypothetical protein
MISNVFATASLLAWLGAEALAQLQASSETVSSTGIAVDKIGVVGDGWPGAVDLFV